MSETPEQNKEKNKREKTRYLIIGFARSGTTVTHLALMGHPNVSALNGELRPEPFFTKGISTFTFGNDPEEEKVKAYSALFDAITLIRANENTFANGAKVVCNSNVLAQALVTVLQNNMRDLKVIVIFRKDIVAQYGSGKIGKKSGIMHSWYKGYEGRKVEKIKINKWLFIAYAQSVRKMYEVLSELKNTHDVLEIHYEDLLVDANGLYAKIFRFLGLPQVEPTWLASKKVLPAPEDYIKNYSALQFELNRLENGTLPSHTLFISKTISRLYWRLSRIMPHNKSSMAKKRKKL